MATTLEIMGWSSVGLRSPDHSLSFEQQPGGDVYPITLLQMPNGTAKTTTLELLRAAFSGSAKRWNRDSVLQYRRDSDTESGTFRLSLRYGGKRLTVNMTFDFVDGIVRYHTTLPFGLQDGFHTPKELRGFLTPQFVNLFVFNGELAHRLLAQNDTNAQDAIDSLFHLAFFRGMISEIQRYWQEEAVARKATEEKGFTQRKNKVDTLRNRITHLMVTRDHLIEQRQETELQLDLKKKHFQDALEAQQDIRELLQQVQVNLQAERHNVETYVKEALNQIRSPHALSTGFAREMVALKKNLDRVKLPESTAREFFVELAQEDVCVCGRPLDDEARRVIRDCADRYLGSDDVAELNALKGAIGSAVEENISEGEEELCKTLASLLAHSRGEAELRTELERIQVQGVRNDPELEAARNEISRLERTLYDIDTELRHYEDRDESKRDKDTYGISVLENRLAQAEEALAQISDTLRLKRKRDVLVALLKNAEENARNGISREMCEQVNSRIAELMPYNRIRIREINSYLVLKDQEGGSVGETLTVGYAFLSTLFGRSDHRLPFVVDSPAGALDYAVRQRVAQLIPQLSGQFIAFIISTEREGFVPVLERSTAMPIQYVTLFRKGNELYDAIAERDVTTTETADAFCVKSPEFFRSFQLDSYD